MKAAEAILMWDVGRVLVDTEVREDFPNVAGAVWEDWDEDLEFQMMTFLGMYHQVTVVFDVPAADVHRELLKIEEYREATVDMFAVRKLAA